ncbi:hypothetical protein AB9L77_04105 [Escherichia coli]|jgi:hypothetical protein|uniref:hypothetical protein n=1 Tax=Escherichia coli TaxID=562 RepID=UPI001F138902|nr:hypothetical protein [Escherichia coli]DAV62401.1 MAG TPA: hypothetical protein [Caudoviricetes sp.]MCH6389566.1 hypothetical protein [Escherichia coli]HCJ9348203.1 hypothetical protein [Escherichia coli]HCJ9425086.1 hypothetical protein [Escherichia coli]HCJ9717536.1 hypothetical protein [Escherichia coli]
MTTPITKEHELRVFITGFLTDPAHDEHSENSMTAQVFRIALAAMDAEPVAWVCAHGDEIEYNGHNQFSGGGQGLPLYTAPPAPVAGCSR